MRSRCLLVSVLALAVAVPSAAAGPRKFKNCAALNGIYPHGVGRPGARDKTSGSPVTSFRVDRALYNANSGKDRDGDGIACEKK